MTLVSFAQNQEDILLWRALRQVSNGFYIDVGAADPSDLSITRLFYDHGWHGINLEPEAEYFAALTRARPHDINLRLAAGREAASLTFHKVDHTGLSTFDAQIAAKHREAGWTVEDESVEVLTLAEICRRYRPHGPIHFLKIDVEGSEGEVLAGADFKTFRPWIVLVEATLPLSQDESWAHWEPMLTDNGYHFVWFDGLNRFYVADEMREALAPHFRTPPNVFDGFEGAPGLLRRAEHAEFALNEVRENAAASVRQAEEASRRALSAVERMSETSAQALRRCDASVDAVRKLASEAQESNRRASAMQQQMLQQMQQLASALTRTAERSDAALLEQARRNDEVQRAAEHAQQQLAWVLSSSSWRLTAPLRGARRAVAGGPRGILRGVKELARRSFRAAGHIVLALPGSRRCVRAVSALAPRQVEWFARRYRAYELGAAQRQAQQGGVGVVAPNPVGIPSPGLRHMPVNDAHAIDTSLKQQVEVLSDEELRVFGQIISSRVGSPD